ncbi:unnamed protein product [Schistosoma curassoni]|uniref:DUF3800 domain-containing protein n=1 Tax=Schistosoma curassoni TaxID=6186 RepID=A0A183JHA6_9TREM|nr:unnamed protein product [Schistosoma curassoni]
MFSSQTEEADELDPWCTGKGAVKPESIITRRFSTDILFITYMNSLLGVTCVHESSDHIKHARFRTAIYDSFKEFEELSKKGNI